MALRTALVVVAIYGVLQAGCIEHCDDRVPPPNVHLTVEDASTRGLVPARADVNGLVAMGCDGMIDALVVGVHDVIVSADGYTPLTIRIDGGSTLKNCALWPTHDLSFTALLTPNGTADGGGFDCGGTMTHD
jgi:hypothetical protein